MRITQRLIEALGYSSGEIDYNAQNKNLRPDYSVSIPEYPLRACFIIEDTVDEVHFFHGIKLFEDAVVQNTITVATRRAPNGQAHSERFWHKTAPKWGTLSIADTQKLRQSHYRADIFRQELPELVLGDAVTSIPLEDIFYISKGMVLNADEKTNRGAFKMEDLIVDQPDHTRGSSPLLRQA